MNKYKINDIISYDGFPYAIIKSINNDESYYELEKINSDYKNVSDFITSRIDMTLLENSTNLDKKFIRERKLKRILK